MARDMGNIYSRMTTEALKRLLSKKFMRVARLENSWGYLDTQELRVLRHHMRQIDAELACRKYQTRLFE